MTILVIAEHNNQQLAPTTRHTITAASQLGEVHVLVLGNQVQTVVEEVKKISHVSKVLYSNAEYYAEGLAEELTPQILQIASSYNYIAASATVFGKNLIPRVAALLDCPQLSDVTEIIDGKTFVRPIYAGNAFVTVQNTADVLALTFRTTAFDAADLNGQAIVEELPPTPQQSLSRFIGRELTQSDRPELTQAKIVVSGGRALGSSEQFDQILTPLANKLGAAIGASRAAVDAGYAPNDYQVGQTGKIVAPELYIAIGISGAIQHIAGMQDSKIIVAINKDPDAPIFNVADYGLVGDLFEIIPELTKQLT